MTLHSTSYLFWKVRYRTCWFFIYALLLDDNFDSKYVLYLVRKVFSRRIQRRRLRGMGPSILRENRQLSDRPLLDQIKNIATFLIQPLLAGLPPLCIGCSPSVVHRFGWCLGCFGGDDDDDDDESHLLPCSCVRMRQCSLPPIVTSVTRGNILHIKFGQGVAAGDLILWVVWSGWCWLDVLEVEM